MRKLLAAITCFTMLGIAAGPGIDVSKTFARIAPALKSRAKIMVLLPTRLPATFRGEKIFPIVDGAGATGYAVDIAFTPDCSGAHFCSAGNVYGSSKPLNVQDVPAGGTRVRLSGNVVALYRASVSGPYPSNAYLSWKQNGAYYALALNTGSVADILLTARSMR